jgi:hypothetical protein
MSEERDYDKDPIVINDVNPLFTWWEMIYIMIPIYMIVVVLFVHDAYKYTHVIVVLPILLWPAFKQFAKAKDKRFIHLTDCKIYYKHEDKIIGEVQIDSESKLSLSFQNYYHESQDNTLILFILVFVVGFIILSLKISLLTAILIAIAFWLLEPLSFQVIKWVKYPKSYRFYQSVIIENQNNFINIPMLTSNDYQEVKKYFARLDYDIENLPKTIKLFTGYEKIEV